MRASNSRRARRRRRGLIDFLNNDLLACSKKRIRADSGIGIKPISIFGTKRLVRSAIRYALETGRKTVTLVHKGNIQKFTEGSFREWGYQVAVEEFRADVITERESWILGNLEKNPCISIEENAALISPGLEFASQSFCDFVCAEVKSVLDTIGKEPWQRCMEVQGAHQRPHRRFHLSADRYSPGGL